MSKVNPTGAAEKCGVWTGDKIISVSIDFTSLDEIKIDDGDDDDLQRVVSFY